MILYALLIGINDYPENPLHQCVADVEKMDDYLKSQEPKFDALEVKSLKNSEATREQVISQIQEHLGKANDADVAFLYYSGHGAQEQTAGLFSDEHDGLLECLVCYDEGEITTRQLLANKEIRYLLHKLPADPHLVTVFDACHSGDIVRSFHLGSNGDDGMVKRISGTFDPRSFEDFIFAEDESVTSKTGDRLEVFIPFKNHLHIAACLSSESSWEDWQGGVFTRYLLKLLESTQGNLSYLDITRWAKISMKDVTRKKQSPTISVQGEGSISAQSSWLNLHPEGVSFPDGQMINSAKSGWIYSRGSLLGVKDDTEVIVTLDDEEVTLPVKSVEIDHAGLEVPMDVIDKLDFDRSSYPARTEISTYSGLRISINMVDDEDEVTEKIKRILTDHSQVQVTDVNDADFSVNIFNGMIYFSLPNQDFQPLAKQIILDSPQEDMKTSLETQLRALVKWHHFYSLENPGKDFEHCPIKVTLKEEGGDWIDVTNQPHRLVPRQQRLKIGLQYQKVTMQVKNISDERLYVGLLTLASDIGITSKPFDGKVIELKPGETKTLYDHRNTKKVYASIDNYKEVYNWKEEWFYYKFIFNNFEDFSAALNDDDYLQPPLDPPLTLPVDGLRGSRPKGEGGEEEMEEVVKKWGTCRTRLELANSTYNVVSADLQDFWNVYASSGELGPFIKELYFEEYSDGLDFELRLKQNQQQSSEEAIRATDSWIVKQLNKLYNGSRRRKFRRQKHQDRPIVIAEGDSWFLFPKPGVRDTIDYIMKEYRLLSLADAGDEIADYIKNNELLEAVSREQPDFVLISGGGNDILGAEIKDILLTNVIDGKNATDFIDTNRFKEKMEFLRDGYTTFFEEINTRKSGATIFIHGYDYVRSNPDRKTIKNGWANKYMIEAGIENPEDRKMIIAHLVDTFNKMLEDFTLEYPQVKYINNRGTVGSDEWMDEIHPNNVGYQKVANNFLSQMKS
ncbi:MAG: caspase family protein [Cyclobacteriaceae bacterium]